MSDRTGDVWICTAASSVCVATSQRTAVSVCVSEERRSKSRGERPCVHASDGAMISDKGRVASTTGSGWPMTPSPLPPATSLTRAATFPLGSDDSTVAPCCSAGAVEVTMIGFSAFFSPLAARRQLGGWYSAHFLEPAR